MDCPQVQSVRFSVLQDEQKNVYETTASDIMCFLFQFIGPKVQHRPCPIIDNHADLASCHLLAYRPSLPNVTTLACLFDGDILPWLCRLGHDEQVWTWYDRRLLLATHKSPPGRA